MTRRLLFTILCIVAGCTNNDRFYPPDGGTGASSGSGSAGTGTGCQPGSSRSCYTGRLGTEMVGVCAAGVQTCSELGEMGPCIGEVTPSVEQCITTTEDENCDGVSKCTGGHLWSKRFGYADSDYASGFSLDAAGNIYLAGPNSGTLDFGGGPLTSAGGIDFFVAKLDQDGNHVWSKNFGGGNDQLGRRVALGPDGDLVVAGMFKGVLDLGGGPLASAGEYDVFVSKFDSSGVPVWSTRFGDSADQYLHGVTIDSDGQIYVTGEFQGNIDFGDGALNASGNVSMYLAKLDRDGQVLWSRRVGTGDTWIFGMGMDRDDNLLLTGKFAGDTDLGGGLLKHVGSGDAFVSKLDTSGNVIWSKSFGDEAPQEGWGIKADRHGNLIVEVDVQGSVDFGGGELPGKDSLNWDIAIVKLDPEGTHLWSKRFGDSNEQGGGTLLVNEADDITFAGYFVGSIDVGGGTIVSAGGFDSFIAKLSSSGSHQWSRRFGDGADQQAIGLQEGPAGHVIAMGSFFGAVDFGGGALTSAGGTDIFLAKLLP
jgi:hypothetical protein